MRHKYERFESDECFVKLFKEILMMWEELDGEIDQQFGVVVVVIYYTDVTSCI